MASDSPTVNRRGFLRAATLPALGTGAAALGYAWGIEPHWCELVRRPMALAGLPAAWRGRTLLHLSDLHIGAADDDYLESVFAAAAQLNPDLIVVTGDFISYRGSETYEPAARTLSRLPAPPQGVFGSFGNHDYGRNWSEVHVAERLARRLADVGVRILRNESVELDGLRLAAIDDLWSPRFERYHAARTIGDAASGPAITLCHNPDACDLPLWRGYRGWILAGHTHGGQCRPPFLPAPIVPVRNHRYTRGEIDLADGRRLYISRGVGYKWRIRFNVRPEMTLFTLESA
jgi:predicted MPP superfamily phosphohydrolase